MNTSNDFDFVFSEDGDLMLLLYADNNIPSAPMFTVDSIKKEVSLCKSKDVLIEFTDIPEKVIQKLESISSLLVCEMQEPSDDEDSDVKYIYEAKKI